MSDEGGFAFELPSLHVRYYVSIIITTALLLVSWYNMCAALRLLMRAPKRIILIVNVAQTVPPLIATLVFLVRKLAPWNVSCADLSIMEAVVTLVGDPLLFLLVLIKAYFVTNRSRSLLVFGSLLICVEFALGLAMHFARHVTGVDIPGLSYTTRCNVSIQSSWITANLVADVCINLFLSLIFLRAVYQQRRIFHHHMYTILFRDGLYFAILIPLSNLASAIVAYLFPIWSGHVYGFDYIFASTLLIWQFEHGYRWRREKARLHRLSCHRHHIAEKQTRLLSMRKRMARRSAHPCFASCCDEADASLRQDSFCIQRYRSISLSSLADYPSTHSLSMNDMDYDQVDFGDLDAALQALKEDASYRSVLDRRKWTWRRNTIPMLFHA